jgi:hypothetical protein
MVARPNEMDDSTMPQPPPPICSTCKNWGGTRICRAYPDGIPEDLYKGLVVHDVSLPGDRGILFDPVSEVARNDAKAWHRYMIRTQKRLEKEE